MKNIQDSINQGRWNDVMQIWNQPLQRPLLISLLKQFTIKERTQITVPHWLTNDQMIIPLLGLLVSIDETQNKRLQEIRLQNHHQEFPQSLAYCRHIKLLQVDAMDNIDLKGIEHVVTHTLVIRADQVEHNMFRLKQMKNLKVLIVCSSQKKTTITLHKLCQSFPFIEEVYGELPLGKLWDFQPSLRYLSFKEGFFFLAQQEGDLAARLIQAKIPNLPHAIYPKLQYLEQETLHFKTEDIERFPNIQVLQDRLGRLVVDESFWQLENDYQWMQVGKMILQLKPEWGTIASRIISVKEGLPSCYAPHLESIELSRGKIKFDRNFAQRYPALKRVRCYSATYMPDFWYVSMPLEGIEETGNYPKTFIFAAFGGVLGERLERLYCNYRWLKKEVYNLPSVSMLCVYQCQNLVPIVQNLIDLKELYVESLPFGKEQLFQLPELPEAPERIVKPYQYAWRDRLRAGGFGFLFVHRKVEDEIWEKWTMGQKVRFTNRDHIENFSYCWEQGYRAARLVDRVTYDDELIQQLQHLDIVQLAGNWLFAFDVTNGYFSWKITLLHRNGRRKMVEETDLFTEARNIFLRRALAEKDGRLQNLQVFTNLGFSEDEAEQLQKQYVGLHQSGKKKILIWTELLNDPEYVAKLQAQSIQRYVLETCDPKLVAVLQTLNSLKCLQVKITAAESLPAEIFSFPQLKEFNVSDCFLTELPFDIVHMQSLEKLLLWNNQLQKLPDDIGQMQNLKVLSCSDNPLENLPTAMRNLKKLERLYLSKTNIRSLPSWLLELEHLQRLDIKGVTLDSDDVIKALIYKGVVVQYG